MLAWMAQRLICLTNSPRLAATPLTLSPPRRLHHAGIKPAAGARRVLGASTWSSDWDRASFPHGGHAHVADASGRQRAKLSLDRPPSGSDATRVGHDAGKIEGASCARRVPSRVYIEQLSTLPRPDPGPLAVRAMAAATVLRIGIEPVLLFRGSSSWSRSGFNDGEDWTERSMEP